MKPIICIYLPLPEKTSRTTWKRMLKHLLINLPVNFHIYKMPSPPWGHLWPFSYCSPLAQLSGSFPFFNSYSNVFLFHNSYQSLPCITVIYVPVLSPLLGMMRVRIKTEIWLISCLRAPSRVTATISTAQWLDVCNLCLPVEATTLLWPSVGGLQESPLWGQCLDEGHEPQSGNWTSVHKWLCWLWPHTHLTFLFSVSSLNVSSALFYFPLLPFLSLKLTALWWALGFWSKLLLMG